METIKTYQSQPNDAFVSFSISKMRYLPQKNGLLERSTPHINFCTDGSQKKPRDS